MKTSYDQLREDKEEEEAIIKERRIQISRRPIEKKNRGEMSAHCRRYE